jgi:hypothetical protein
MERNMNSTRDGLNWHAGHIGDGEFRRETVFDETCGQVCEVTMRGEIGATDARLIAAAPALLAALEATASMLALEAKCHEESGDEKRRRYVEPIRGQVAAARTALARARGVTS